MDNIFTQKAGPIPVWAWLAIITVVVLAFVSLRKGGSSSAATTAQQQQAQYTAQQAALANIANANSPTYGSGYGNYAGNGWAGRSGNYQMSPAASTTSTGTTGPTTAPAPVPVATTGTTTATS